MEVFTTLPPPILASAMASAAWGVILSACANASDLPDTPRDADPV